MESNNGFRIRNKEGKKEIFDPVRRRFVALTEEEMVRQTYLKYLIDELKIPKITISVEKKIIYNTLAKRYDIVVANPNGSILLVVECKAVSVSLDDNTLSQIAIYNAELQSKYLVLFNGKQQIVFQRKEHGYIQIDGLPEYNKMQSINI